MNPKYLSQMFAATAAVLLSAAAFSAEPPISPRPDTASAERTKVAPKRTAEPHSHPRDAKGNWVPKKEGKKAKDPAKMPADTVAPKAR